MRTMIVRIMAQLLQLYPRDDRQKQS